jgi:hypothetical protein
MNFNYLLTLKTRFVKKNIFAPVIYSLLAALFLTACKKENTGPETYYGPSIQMGGGTVRSYITIGNDGNPQSMGLRMTENAMTNLPADTSNMMALMTTVALPDQAKNYGYNHIEIDWHPYGHDPQMYEVPHFDFHFYLIDTSTQRAIVPGPDTVSVPAQYIPQDYFSGVMAVPNMGVHWLDSRAPELNGQPFTDTFIYGFYHGKLIFLEPMITLQTITSKKEVDINIKQPQAFQQPGYYPTLHKLYYDSSTKEYVVAMEGLQKH